MIKEQVQASLAIFLDRALNAVEKGAAGQDMDQWEEAFVLMNREERVTWLMELFRSMMDEMLQS